MVFLIYSCLVYPAFYLSGYSEIRPLFPISFCIFFFTFPTEMRVENVHFCPITAFLPFLFLPSEGVKTALEATFSALLITFPASPRWKNSPQLPPVSILLIITVIEKQT